MSTARFCWFCNGSLVGPGGVHDRDPLFFKLVKIHDDREVRVHVQCEQSTKDFVKVFTAQPPIKE